MNKDLYNDIKNDSLIKLADDPFTLQDYVKRYFSQDITILEAETYFNLLHQPETAPIAPAKKVVAKKKTTKAKTQKLAAA